MNLLRYRYDKNDDFLVLYLLFSIIVVTNILTISNPLNLIITLPQYGLVLYYLFKGDIRNSALLHFVFCTLSLSAQGTLGMMDSLDFNLYNYAGIKLIGPVRASYFMNIVFVFILMNNNHKIDKTLLFYKLYKTLLYLCVTASIIGLLGLLFHPFYSLEGFISYGIYAFVIVTSSYILLKVANYEFIKATYYCVLIAMMAGVAGSFICYIAGGVVSHYSVFDIVYLSDITVFATALLIGLAMIKQKVLLGITLILLFSMQLKSLGGKGIVMVAFGVAVLLYLLFFDSKTKIVFKKHKWIKPLVFFSGIFAVLYVIRNVGLDSMVGYKFMSAASVFSNDLSEMSDSPYIRIASLINILNEGIENPFVLLFGNGYGGYFEDKLNLFVGIDLSNGAWKDNVIAAGRFTSGHDTMVTVPLFNGLIGLFFLLRICWLYIKKIPFNFLNSIAFFWIVLMFYFNTNYAFIGLFALMGAEFDVWGQSSYRIVSKK